MQRFINSYLIQWKNDTDRKVLLLRGARQVGKTYAIRTLGKTFKNCLEVNFEENQVIHGFFRDSLDPQKICEKLSAYFKQSIVPGETLLFFDEIQACPPALSALRFFYEKMPLLHVVATGSLLEFALSEIPSQGVGRIHSLFMLPMNFTEFLLALGADGLVRLLDEAPLDQPLDAAFHRQLLDHVKTFQLIGGLPEVVKTYVQHHDLLKCQQVIDDLIILLKDDFAKYKHRSPVLRLQEVLQAIPYCTGSKFKYSNVDTTAAAASIKAALELLLRAGLAYKVFHTAAQGIPLGAQINPNKFKVILFDAGIQQRLLGLDLSAYVAADEFSVINKGSLAEAFVGISIIGHGSPTQPPQLYYWHRESKSSNAEVDYVWQKNERIIPIEVKAGTKGQMQSLRWFMQERNLIHGVRISLENFSHYEMPAQPRCHQIQVLPLYAVSKLLQL